MEKVVAGIGIVCMIWGVIWGIFFPSFIWLAAAGLAIGGISYPFLEE